MRVRTEQQRERLEAHVFVCTTDRDSDHACCGDAAADETHDAVVSWLRERDAFWTAVSVTTTGCLGLCSEDGAAIAIQPRNEWYSDVRPADVPDLLADAFGPNAERVTDSSAGDSSE